MRSTENVKTGELVRWYDWKTSKTIMATVSAITGDAIYAHSSKNQEHRLTLDDEVQIKRNNRWTYL